MHALRFAGKFLLVIAAVVTLFWLLGVSFRFSRWTGFLSLGGLAVGLYASAQRWVVWLPGLLIFGVLNSLLVLETHNSLVGSRITVSTGLSALLLAFYAVGCITTYYYDAERLSVFDRCALLVYLACMTWPIFSDGSNLGIVTPAIAWACGVGMAALIVSIAIHRIRGSKTVTKRSQAEIQP